MKTLRSAIRCLALLFTTLSLVQFAHAGQAQNYTTYNPVYTTLQNVVYSNPANGQYLLQIQAPGDIPPGTTSNVTINFAPLVPSGGQAFPSGVSNTTGLSYISAQTTTGTLLTVGTVPVNTIPVVGGNTVVTVLITVDVPLGATAGGYGYLITTTGWALPTVDAGATVNASVILEDQPTIMITAPTPMQVFPSVLGTSADAYSFTASATASGVTITSLTGYLTSAADPSLQIALDLPVTVGTGTTTATVTGIQNLAPGTYTLYATATDSVNVTVDTSVTFSVVAPTPPSIVINTPTSNQVFVVPIGSTTFPVPIYFQGASLSATSKDTVTATLVGAKTGTVAFTPVVGGLTTSANITSTTPVSLPADTYTLTVTDSDLAGSATATTTFTVQDAATPTITITSPTSTPTILIPIGSTTASVPYSIVGSTSGGTVDTAIVSASGTLYSGAAASGTVAATVAQSSFTGIGTASISATGSFTLAAGTYTLSATESNVGSVSGGETINATPVTFTVVQELAPTIAISAPANGTTIVIPAGQTSVTPTFTISGGTKYGTITSDSAALVTGSSPSPSGTPVTGFSATYTGTGTTSIASSGTLPALTAGTYTLSATDSNGLTGGSATAISTFTVTQPATPSVAITAPATTITIPPGATTVAVTYGFTGATSTGSSYTTITSASATLVNSLGTSVAITPTISNLNTASITGSGTVTLGAGTYTLTAVDSNGAPNGSGGTVSATASETFTVVQAATPTITITAPTANQSFTIPAGSSSLSVSYAFTGAASGGTLDSTIISTGTTLVNSSGTSIAITPTVTGLGTASVSGSGTVSLAAGTYTLTALDSNGALLASGATDIVQTSVTFTVVQGQSTGGTGGGSSSSGPECLVWLQGNCGNQSNCNGGRGYNNCGGYNNLGNYCNSGGYCSNSSTQYVTGGTVVPVAFALYNCSNSNYCNNWWGGYNYGSGCNGNFVTDTTDVISISEVYNDGASSNPVIYSYSATSSVPPYFTIANNEYLLNFPTAAGSHQYSVEVYHPTSTGSLTLLGSETICTNSSCVPSQSTSSCGSTSTTIAKGATIWFTNVVNPTNSATQSSNLVYDSSTITFKANGSTVTLNVPAATIQMSTTATTATTTFNATTNSWLTVVPASYNGNVFLTAVAYTVPATITGGIGNVTWSGGFRCDQSVSCVWQWSAAVYSQFSTNMNALGVKAISSNTQNAYTNSDLAGTPENYKQYVVSGACGTGGTNYTGNLCSPCTAQVSSSCWSNSCSYTNCNWGWGQNGDGCGYNISCGGAWGNGGSGSTSCGNAGKGNADGTFCTGWDSQGNCTHTDTNYGWGWGW